MLYYLSHGYASKSIPGFDFDRVRCFAHRLHQNHTTSVTTVIGTDRAQYTQKWRDTVNDEFPVPPLGSKEKKFVPKSVSSWAVSQA
jgi:hypothetical protein